MSEINPSPSNETADPYENWAERPYTGGQLYIYRDVDGKPVPGAAISWQIALHPEAPDDFVDGLSTEVSCAINKIISDNQPE